MTGKNIHKKIGRLLGNEDFFIKKNLAAIIVIFVIGASFMYFINASQQTATTTSVNKVVDFVKSKIDSSYSVSLQSYKAENGFIKYDFELSDGSNSEILTVYSDLKATQLFPSAMAIDNEEKFDAPDSEIPTVELYVMSFCPHGTQAEDVMLPVFGLLEGKANINLRYILSEETNGEISSMHGQEEVDENLRQICVKYVYGKSKMWNYIEAFNRDCIDMSSEDAFYESLANAKTCSLSTMEKLNIDSAKIDECITSKGDSLLAAEVQASGLNQIYSSPSLIINGVEYDGGRTSESFKEGICTGFADIPPECSTSLSNTATTASGSC